MQSLDSWDGVKKRKKRARLYSKSPAWETNLATGQHPAAEPWVRAHSAAEAMFKEVTSHPWQCSPSHLWDLLWTFSAGGCQVKGCWV